VSSDHVNGTPTEKRFVDLKRNVKDFSTIYTTMMK
jgi:hypothetical protein